jgi:O-antigen/teichoic acid export membrane protein
MKPSGIAAVRSRFTRERLTGPTSVLVTTSVANNLLRLASTIVLTRLLAPNDFGLIAMVGSIFYVIIMLTDAGFQAYIVRHERDDPHFLDAIWTVHFARGLFNAGVAAAMAVPLASLLRKPELAPLVAVAAVSIAVDGSASLSLLTALRRNMVRRLSLIDLVAQIGQFAVGVIAALILRNAWALVISLIASSVIRTTASYLIFPEASRRLRYDRSLTVELWRFSRVIAVSSMLTLVIAQVDKLVLARVMSLQQFGIYAIAVNLAAVPAAIATQYMSRIFYPAMAETWRTRPELIKQQYYALRGTLFFAYLFGGGALIGGAPLVIRILYDPRYSHSGFYLQLLAISATLVLLTSAPLNALVAVGQVRTSLISNLIRLGWLLPVGLTGLIMFGPIGLIVALALIELPAYVYLNRTLIKQRMFDLRPESLAWLVIGCGVAAGLVCDAAAAKLFSL